MMNRFIMTLFLVVTMTPCFSFSLPAEQSGELKFVLKPQMIRVTSDTLYVVEGHRIFHYRLKDLHFNGIIGKEGEGPGEFRLDPSRTLIISISNQELRAESRTKMAVFSLDGHFLREEHKTPSTLQTLPIGNNILVHHIINEPEGRSYFALDLCKKNGQKIKELYRQKFFQFGSNLTPIADGLNFWIIGDRVWVEESPDGFVLEQFDSHGRTLRKVTHQVPRLKVTPKDRESAYNQYLKIPSLYRLKKEQGEAALKQFIGQLNFVYPDNFPTIRHLKWDGERLYLRSFEQTIAGNRHWVLDEAGELLGSTLLPPPQEVDFLVNMQGDKQFYDFFRGHYFYLRSEMDDEGDEHWYLHREKVEIVP